MKVLKCPIVSIDRYNDDTRSVVLALPEHVNFHAGQYLQIILPEKKLPFSIASAPQNRDSLELHIRPTPGSEDSEAVEALLDSSKILEIEMPLGDCYITNAPDHPLILIAASTGITQMKSIIEHLIEVGMTQSVYLYWGVLNDNDLYLADLCNLWARDFNNFYFVPVVSEPEKAPNWSGRTGLVGDAVLEDFKDLSNVTIIVSGGPNMVYATFDAFVNRGMPANNMKSDIFSYAPRG